MGPKTPAIILMGYFLGHRGWDFPGNIISRRRRRTTTSGNAICITSVIIVVEVGSLPLSSLLASKLQSSSPLLLSASSSSSSPWMLGTLGAHQTEEVPSSSNDSTLCLDKVLSGPQAVKQKRELRPKTPTSSPCSVALLGKHPQHQRRHRRRIRHISVPEGSP